MTNRKRKAQKSKTMKPSRNDAKLSDSPESYPSGPADNRMSKGHSIHSSSPADLLLDNNDVSKAEPSPVNEIDLANGLELNNGTVAEMEDTRQEHGNQLSSQENENLQSESEIISIPACGPATDEEVANTCNAINSQQTFYQSVEPSDSEDLKEQKGHDNQAKSFLTFSSRMTSLNSPETEREERILGGIYNFTNREDSKDNCQNVAPTAHENTESVTARVKLSRNQRRKRSKNQRKEQETQANTRECVESLSHDNANTTPNGENKSRDEMRAKRNETNESFIPEFSDNAVGNSSLVSGGNDAESHVTETKLSRNQRRKRNRRMKGEETQNSVTTPEAVSTFQVVPEPSGSPYSPEVDREVSREPTPLQDNNVNTQTQVCTEKTPLQDNNVNTQTQVSTEQTTGQTNSTQTQLVPYDREFADIQRKLHWSICAWCKSEGYNMKRCRWCEQAMYCNRECRKLHKPQHKANCRRFLRFCQARSEVQFLDIFRGLFDIMDISFFLDSLPDITRYNLLGGLKIWVLVEIVDVIPHDIIWKAQVKDVANQTIEVVFNTFNLVPTLGNGATFLEGFVLARNLKPGNFMLIMNSYLSFYETKAANVFIKDLQNVKFITLP